uniref:thiamine biosynthesis protein S n=1 Tax=Goniotrichopsis reniformis TaxID=468933 RepID=UPI001FCDFFE9|nr:thiamine biosynthesis protein S [Goniotrichopsis reniformis]UNJ14893.1 thiamine biosynthesis protein S [Goniotrichopsis reniformis]
MNISSNTITDKITVFINGDPFICVKNTSLASLLNYLDFDFRQIVVEHNSEIIKKEKLASSELKNQDIIEIVTIVGGG